MYRGAALRVIGTALLALCAVFSGVSGTPCQAAPDPDVMAVLLRELSTSPAPSPEKRADVCLRLLEQEMTSPSAAAFGIGGGPIDSGYLQEVIMGVAGVFPKRAEQRPEIRARLAKKLASTPTSNQALRDRITVMLGMAADSSVIPQLIRILEQHPEGFMRHSAAMALRDVELNDDAIAALKRAVATDTYARVRFGGANGCLILPGQENGYDSKTMVYSPVRNTASLILRGKGVSVAKGAEVIDGKYAAQRLEPLLYDSKNPVATCRLAVIESLEKIASSEAKAALQAFVDKERGAGEMKALVDRAQKALAKLGG